MGSTSVLSLFSTPFWCDHAVPMLCSHRPQPQEQRRRRPIGFVQVLSAGTIVTRQPVARSVCIAWIMPKLESSEASGSGVRALRVDVRCFAPRPHRGAQVSRVVNEAANQRTLKGRLRAGCASLFGWSTWTRDWVHARHKVPSQATSRPAAFVDAGEAFPDGKDTSHGSRAISDVRSWRANAQQHSHIGVKA